MKLKKILLMLLITFLVVSSAIAEAGDFDWIKDFNVRAEADMSGFRARLEARFKIGAAQVHAVLSQVEKPAEAYMVFRLAEMAGKPTEVVIEKYKTQKGRGWGELAKSLGIKPGSKEFHALKRGSDLYVDNDKGKGKEKSKGKP